ncbi:MAG: hypothetical protein EOP53_06830 [Sphingobacteriales bacterium]|nr:MAG: hypothetical protein EOP53_06830 [Sphingobacteriales bacterium]
MKFICRILVSLALIVPAKMMAQKPTWEIGLFLGASNYQGDLAPNIVVAETKPAIGGFIKRAVNDYFAYSLGLNYGTVSGDDKNFKYLAPRNMHFQSEIFEITPQVEFNFFRFGSSPRAHKFTPYLFTGLSYFKFNPKAKLNDEWVRLQPLTTEGQGIIKDAPKKYSLWQFAIPIGAGLKFNLSPEFNMTVNCGFRSAFTDYLDDVGGVYPDRSILDEARGGDAAYFSDPSGAVSGINIGVAGKQRGNSDTKDWYIFSGVTLSYIIRQGTCYTF